MYLLARQIIITTIHFKLKEGKLVAGRKKQNYWYVLVLTNEGPKFVTKVEWQTKTAHWEKLEAPIELGETRAKDLTFGLMVNCYAAFAICSPIELDSQPYLYNLGQFEWKFFNENAK